MKHFIIALSVSFLIGVTTYSDASENQQTQDNTSQTAPDRLLAQHQEEEEGHEHDGAEEGHHEENKKVQAEFEDFPNLHPLIVHFAIVLLLVGALIHIVNIFLLKKAVAWIAFAIVALGALTAYLAGKTFHPHTHELTAHAKLVLEQHDYWADWTINLGIIGAILQGINLFFLTQKRWAMTIVALVLVGTAYAVSQAGHYGSQLVHIEGVGPQGKFLESGEEHSH